MHSRNLKNQVCLLYIRTLRLKGLDLLTKNLLLRPFGQYSNQALMTMPVLSWPDVPFFNTRVFTCDTIELGLMWFLCLPSPTKWSPHLISAHAMSYSSHGYASCSYIGGSSQSACQLDSTWQPALLASSSLEQSAVVSASCWFSVKLVLGLAITQRVRPFPARLPPPQGGKLEGLTILQQGVVFSKKQRRLSRQSF